VDVRSSQDYLCIYVFAVFFLLITIPTLLRGDRVGADSQIKRALYQESSPDLVLQTTENLAPSVQHEEVVSSMITFNTSALHNRISSYALFVFYVRLFCLYLMLRVLQLSSPLLVS
jgi:hypothetical protein